MSGIWLSHSSTQRPIRLWTKWLGNDVDAGESRAIHPAEMLFTYGVIGGLEGVDRWLTVWKKFSLCVGTLTSRWYSPQIGYNDFFSTVTAAETFERIRRNKQIVKLNDGLRELICAVGKPFRDLVADVNGWVNRIVQTRATTTWCIPDCAGTLTAEDLYWKTELVYTLVVLPAAARMRVAGGGLAEPRQLRADEKTRRADLRTKLIVLAEDDGRVLLRRPTVARHRLSAGRTRLSGRSVCWSLPTRQRRRFLSSRR